MNVDITPDDITFYRTHGYWVSGQVLSDSMLDDLTYAVSRYTAGEQDRSLPKAIIPRWSGSVERGVRQADYLSLQLDAVMDFVCDPQLPKMASALSGASNIRLFHDQLIWKSPGAPDATNSVGWHTDKAYWRSCTSDKMLTVWIPLQDITVDMGSLAVWDGSHLWPNADQWHTFDQPDLEILEKQAQRSGLIPNIKILPLQRGQVSFHHCRLIHGSYPNRSPQPRLAFAVHYQDGENRHNGCLGYTSTRAATHLNDMLCRTLADGTPDYSDPDICPSLFSDS